MSDLAKRLREVPTMGHDAGCVIEAADEIERKDAAIQIALSQIAFLEASYKEAMRLLRESQIMLSDYQKNYQRCES